VPVSPQSTGDILVLTVMAQYATTPQVASVSGGGVSSWSKAVASIGNSEQFDIEVWWGVVTSTGSSNINVAYTGSVPAYVELMAQEFAAGHGVTWSLGTTGGSVSTTQTVTFPALTASSAGQLYVGYAAVPGSATPGSTPGFTYDAPTGLGNVFLYDTDVTGTADPTANDNGPSSDAAAALFMATEG
jgi:hypothetical protein